MEKCINPAKNRRLGPVYLEAPVDLQGATFDPDDYTGFTAMLPLIISDPTLRDGSHAVKHQLTREHLHLYSRMAEKAGLAVLEVGHIK